MGAPIVQELVDRLAELRAGAPRTATVVVPLKEGAIGRARELVARARRSIPADTPLIRHELLLTPQEAIFVFEAEAEDGLRALLGQLDIWAAAAAWRELVAGPPRLAEVAYAWERPEPTSSRRRGSLVGPQKACGKPAAGLCSGPDRGAPCGSTLGPQPNEREARQ